MIRAAALIAGPILFAALVFQLRAPGRAPGVYVEVESGAEKGMYAVPGHDAAPAAGATGISAQTPAIPDGVVHAFFTVGLELATDPSSSSFPELHFFAVDHADGGFRSDPLRVPITIRPVSAGVYRIASHELGPESRAWPYYRQVLARAPGSRATIEVVVALVVPDSQGRRRMYAVRFGPRR
jgi:hypothetical protein